MGNNTRAGRARARTRLTRTAWLLVPLLAVLAYTAITTLTGPADVAPGVEAGSAEVDVPSTAVPAPMPALDPPASEGNGATAAELLATLPVKGRAPKTGYDRDQVRQRLGRRRPQRLRHPQRHPRPRPHEHQAGTSGCLRAQPAPSPTRTPARPSTSCAARAPRRPCRSTTSSPCERVAEGRAAAARPSSGSAFANDPLNLLAVDGPSNCQQGRRRRRHLAATGEGLPLRVRRPPDRREGQVRALGDRAGARRDRAACSTAARAACRP